MLVCGEIKWTVLRITWATFLPTNCAMFFLQTNEGMLISEPIFTSYNKTHKISFTFVPLVPIKKQCS